MSASVNGVVVLAYRVSGAKSAAKNAQDIATEVKHSGKEAAAAATGFEKFSGGIEKAVKRSHSWVHTAKGMAGAWLGVSAAFEAKDFLKDSAQEAIKNQAAMRTFTLALHNTTRATKEQVKESSEWVDSMATGYGFIKTDLLRGYQQLAQVTGSTEKAQRLLRLAMDASAATGKPLTAVTMALVRAQNGNLAAIGKMGIKTFQYTKNLIGIQKAQIGAASAQKAYNDALSKHGKNSVDAGIAAARLKVAIQALADAHAHGAKHLLTFDELTKQMAKTFKGQAQAQAESFEGKMRRLSETFNELKIKIGNALLPLFAKFADFMLHKVAPAIEHQVHNFQEFHGIAGLVHHALNLVFGVAKSVFGFFASHKTTTQDLAIAVVSLYVGLKLVHGSLAVVRAAMVAWNVVQGISVFLSRGAAASYELQGTALKAYMVMTKIATVGQWLWNAAVAAFPVFLIIAAIALIVAAIAIAVYEIVKHWKQIEHAFVVAWKAILGFFKSAWNKIKSLAASGAHAIAHVFVSLWNTVKDGTVKGWNKVWGFIKSIPGKVIGLFAGAGKWLVNAGTGLMDGLWKGIKGAASAVGGFAVDIGKAIVNGIIGFINTVVIDPFDSALHGIGAFGVHPFGDHTIPNIPKLRHGGDVTAGHPYIVGDGGVPELFVPDRAGHVYPSVSAGAIAAGLPAASADGGGALVVHAHIDLDGERVFDGVLGAAQTVGAFA